MTLKNDSSLSLTLQLLIFATFLVVGVSESSHPKKPMVESFDQCTHALIALSPTPNKTKISRDCVN